MILLKQLRGEFVEVIAPVEPGVGPGRFFINDIEVVLLEHLNRGFGCFDEEVVFAGGEPNKLEIFFEFGIVERCFVTFLPAGLGV